MLGVAVLGIGTGVVYEDSLVRDSESEPPSALLSRSALESMSSLMPATHSFTACEVDTASHVEAAGGACSVGCFFTFFFQTILVTVRIFVFTFVMLVLMFFFLLCSSFSAD